MLDYARLRPGEAADRVAVTVTFMEMRLDADRPAVRFPAGMVLQQRRLSVAAYRRVYDGIGAPWLWWLRRVMPDELLKRHLENPAVSTHLLGRAGNLAGFFELEGGAKNVNLNYFGLMPDAIGGGLGRALLQAAIGQAARLGQPGSPVRMTVNTCTADHPRALPNYREAGFREIRKAQEIWDIPRRLGFTIPGHLRV